MLFHIIFICTCLTASITWSYISSPYVMIEGSRDRLTLCHFPCLSRCQPSITPLISSSLCQSSRLPPIPPSGAGMDRREVDGRDENRVEIIDMGWIIPVEPRNSEVAEWIIKEMHPMSPVSHALFTVHLTVFLMSVHISIKILLYICWKFYYI